MQRHEITRTSIRLGHLFGYISCHKISQISSWCLNNDNSFCLSDRTSDSENNPIVSNLLSIYKLRDYITHHKMEAKSTRQRLCPHIEDRDIERKEFRDQFNRELADRKSWEEQFLGGERKTERKATASKAPPSPPSTPEPEEQKKVQQKDGSTQQEDRANKLRERLAADMLDQEIRQHKFMAEVEEVKNRQDELYERMEEQRKKMEGEASEDERY